METDELIGRTFGHYRVVKPLGEGGMAVVYQAEDTHLARLVAVKVLKIFLSGSAQEFGQRFEREATALARLQHPNIVPVLDYGSLDNRYPYLVMPFLSGGTLEDRTGTPMPYARVAELLAPIADALAYAHRAGVIHRDVKPSNILLTESGRPMLSDFGIARLAEDAHRTKLTATGAALGTPGYLAPEQWTGASIPQTDIYALGMVFYELVTGHNPYTGDTPQVVLYKQMMQSLTAPRALVPSLPEEVELALMKALARAADDRYADMASFAWVLQKIAIGDLAAVRTLLEDWEPAAPEFSENAGNAPTVPADADALDALTTQTVEPFEDPAAGKPAQQTAQQGEPRPTILLDETLPVENPPAPGAPVTPAGNKPGGQPVGGPPGKISDPSLLAEMKRTPISLEKQVNLPGAGGKEKADAGKKEAGAGKGKAPGGGKKGLLPLVLFGLGGLALFSVVIVVLGLILVPRLLSGPATAEPTRTAVAGEGAAPTKPALAAPTEAKAEVPPAAPPAAGPVTVVWYVRDSAGEKQWAEEQVIPTFEARSPNIKIQLVVAPGADFDGQLQSMIDAGQPPDIWSHWGTAGFRDYVQRGLVADLSPYVAADGYDLADFHEQALNAFVVDGKLYGLPIFTSGSFVFYNKTLFDRSGIPYPPADWNDTEWTWDRFLWKCKAMTSVHKNPSTDVFGCNLDLGVNDAYAWLWGKGLYPDAAYQTGFADAAFLDDPLVIEAFQARQNLVWDLHYMPNAEQVEAFGVPDLFLGQKVAMQLAGGLRYWNYASENAPVDFRMGVAALPYGSDDRRDVVFSDPWMLSSKSAHPREAWEFLKYLASPEVQESWMNLTGTPPARASLAEQWYTRFPEMTADEVRQVFLGALQYGRPDPRSQLVRYDQLDQVVSAAVAPVFDNERPANEALPEANQTLIDSLRQIQMEFGH